ncbi:MAG: hypothetical protein ABSB25_02655 [Sedimentisphaerales bacterium]|jgi:hypothetical protein
MKRLPKHDLPDENKIRQVALEYLPKDYILKRVECTYGSGGFSAIVPDDFEVIIEYQNRTDERFRGTELDIEKYQNWAKKIEAYIRSKWPPETIRICFSQVESYDGDNR